MRRSWKNAHRKTAQALGSVALAVALTLGAQVSAQATELGEAVDDIQEFPATPVEDNALEPASDLVVTEYPEEEAPDDSAVAESEGNADAPTVSEDASEEPVEPTSADEEAPVVENAAAEGEDSSSGQDATDADDAGEAATPTADAAPAALTVVSKNATAAAVAQSAPAGATTRTTPTGAFAIETGLGYGIVADVKGGSTSNKANVQIYRSNDTTAQRWRLEFHGDVCYVVNVKSGKVLDVAGGKAAKGANVQLYKANGTKAQLWIPEQLPNGSWVLRSALDKSYVLDVASGSIKNGTNLRLWTSNGSRAQTFWLRETNANVAGTERVLDDGTYVISTSLTPKSAIDIKGASTSKGANVQLYNNNGSNAQRFYVTYVDGYYTFQNVTSGLALDLYGASPVAGANVQLWTVNHSAAQQWSVVEVGDGSYRLVNRASGLVLDLASGKTANGTNIRGYYSNGSGAQTWVFTSTTLLADGFYTIADSTGNVLDIAGGSTSAGSAVQRHAGNGSMAQRFYVRNNGDDVVEVQNVGSAKWVSDSGTSVVQAATADTWTLVWNGAGIVLTNGSTYLGFNASGKAAMGTRANAATVHALPVNLFDAGYYQFKNLVGTALDTAGQAKTQANAVTNTAGDSVSQIWYVTSRGNGNYSLVNLKSGLALEVTSSAKTNGVLARQATYTGAQKQLWKVVWDQKNGGLLLVNAATGLALDVAGGSTSAGAKVQQYAANGSAAQSWHLVDKTLPAIVERIAQVSEHFTKHDVHGYSIPNRGCGSKETITLADGTKVTITSSDVDCSEMVRQCINAAVNSNIISYLDTRIQDTVLKAIGFVRINFKLSELKRGDILWVSGHTGVYVGNNMQADAHQDEYGNLDGPNKGDQTGHEVEIRNLRTTWTYIYRLTA